MAAQRSLSSTWATSRASSADTRRVVAEAPQLLAAGDQQALADGDAGGVEVGVGGDGAVELVGPVALGVLALVVDPPTAAAEGVVGEEQGAWAQGGLEDLRVAGVLALDGVEEGEVDRSRAELLDKFGKDLQGRALADLD